MAKRRPVFRERDTAEMKGAVRQHNIDESTGKAAVFAAGETAWHKLGVTITDAINSSEAIKLAIMDWMVEKWPLYAIHDDDEGTIVQAAPGAWATVRKDTGAVLGTVGSNYRPLQNVEAFDFMDALVGDKLAMYETAGSLNNGERVWMLARIPKEYKIHGKQDVIAPYVLLTNTHNGKETVRMMATAVRVVCNNTLNLALNEADRLGQGIRFRHTSTMKSRIEEARLSLGIITQRFSTFEAEAQLLSKHTLTDKAARDYVESLFPVKVTEKKDVPAVDLDAIIEGMEAQEAVIQELMEGAREVTERQAKKNAATCDLIIEMMHNERNNLKGMEHSAWSAFNAVTEWVDHTKSFRNDNSKLQSTWFGAANQIKQEAYRGALELINAV